MDVYNKICFVVNNEEESDIIQYKLLSLGYNWGRYGKFDLENYPSYIFVNNIDKFLSYMDVNSLKRNYTNTIENYLEFSTKQHKEINSNIRLCNKCFTIKDINRVESIFKGDIPSYQPRKIERTLESNLYNDRQYVIYKFNNNPYDVIIYHYEHNRENFTKLMNFLDKHPYFDNRSRSHEFIYFRTTYYYFTLKNIDRWLQFSIYESQSDEFAHYFVSTWPQLKPYPGIVYNVEDLDKIISNILSGGTPSYQPKKIERTLESVSYKYEDMVFMVNNKEEYEYVLKELFKRNVYWYGSKSQSLKEQDGVDYPIYLFYDIDDQDVTYSNNANILGYIQKRPHIDPHIRNYKDVDRIDFILSGAPTYYPKKIERTIESVENNKYNEVVFKVENKNEFDKIQTDLFMMGYKWVGRGRNKMVFDETYFPLYVFVNKNKFISQLNDSEDESTIIDYIEYCNRQIKENINPMIYKYSDAKFINNILKYGYIKPDYEPKKIIRTLETLKSYEEHKFDIVVIKANNRNEVLKIQTILFEKGYYWDEEEDSTVVNDYWKNDEYPVYLFVYYDNTISYMSSKNIMFNVEQYVKYCIEDLKENVDPTIYGLKDVKFIDSILKTGYSGPTYQPKKIERTLEALKPDENYKYDIVVFKVNDRIDNERVQLKLFKLGYYWYSGKYNKVSDQWRDDEYPVYLFVYQERNIRYMGETSLLPYGGIDRYIKYCIEERGQNICKTIYEYNEVEQVDTIFRTGHSGPIYLPRKIKRTLESLTSDEKYKYDIIVFKAINKKENEKIQLSLFKYGYRWEFQDYSEFNDQWKNSEYPIYLFVYKQGNIAWMKQLGIMEYGDIYGYINYCIEHGENVDKTVYGCNEAEQIDTIFRTGHCGPTYLPRKIERTLEGVNNLNKNYKYKVIVVKVENKEELDLLYEKLFEVIHIPNASDIRGYVNDFPNYVFIDVHSLTNDDYLDMWFLCNYDNDYEYLSGKIQRYVYNDPYVNHHIFTLNEIKTVKNILLYGDELYMPTYEPRKIERTLESISTKYDIFVFEVNNKEEHDFVLDNLDGIILCDIDNKNYDGYIIYNKKYHNIKVNDRDYYELYYNDIYGYIEDRKTGYDEKVCPNIFNYKDSANIKHIIRTNGLLSPTYQPKKIERTLESYSPENFKEKLINGKYDLLLFDLIDMNDQKEIFRLLDKTNIFKDLNRLLEDNPLHFIYGINIKDEVRNYIPFELYSFGRDDIIKFFKDKRIFDPERISPIMNAYEFKNYIKSFMTPSYTPKKIDKNI